MGQTYIKVTWDQFTNIEEMVEHIKHLCEGNFESEIHRDNIWVKGTKDELTIIIQIDDPGD